MAEEESKNVVSRHEVVKVVLFQQLMQAAFSTVVMLLTVCSTTSVFPLKTGFLSYN
jgi:hypothetical protein